MNQLNKYGDMLGNLSLEIQDDLTTKTIEELLELENECKSVTNINCSWSEYRISRTVLEAVIYEMDKRRESK